MKGISKMESLQQTLEADRASRESKYGDKGYVGRLSPGNKKDKICCQSSHWKTFIENQITRVIESIERLTRWFQEIESFITKSSKGKKIHNHTTFT